MRMRPFLLVLLAGAGLSPITPASAACFEDGIGCTNDHYISTPALNRLSCENLWMVRNSIFDENGYCFSTSRGRRFFSNNDCFVSDQASVSLNSYERSNVARILTRENQLGCR